MSLRIFRARRPAEAVRVHFTTDVVQSREALRAALDRSMRRWTREGWNVFGEVLDHRVQLSIRWQDNPALAQRLTGNLVAAPSGGSDFIGEIGVPRWYEWFFAGCVLLYAALLLCGAIWLGATCLDARSVAHLLSPVARLLPYWVPSTSLVLYLNYRRAKARPKGPDEALKDWLTDIAAQAPGERA